ncbi:MAG TPA: hypothetical protein PKD91_09220, partial [Bacteroidia bacterium]|nr:hypothetical protein [Bacteroidia bacterium]
MKRYIRLLWVFLLLLLCNPVFSQTKKELEKKKQQLQREIEETNKQLQATSKSKKLTASQVDALK